jgi:hypothetical protein
MDNIVPKFTISDIQDAIQRADHSAAIIPQAFALGAATLDATTDVRGTRDRAEFADRLGTKRSVEVEEDVPFGVLRCYTTDDAWFETRINGKYPILPGREPVLRNTPETEALLDRSPIVTGGSTPGGPAESGQGPRLPADVTFGKSYPNPDPIWGPAETARQDGALLVAMLRRLQDDVTDPARKRELALAITNIEQGLLWLDRAVPPA